MTDTSNVSRLFRDIGLDDDEPDSHMVRVSHPSWPYRCFACGGGLRWQPTRRDPETDGLLCDACWRYRTRYLRAVEDRRENKRHPVKREQT